MQKCKNPALDFNNFYEQPYVYRALSSTFSPVTSAKKLQATKEEQNQLKHELTQNAAHELKTPVASIQGYLETVLTHPDISDEMRQQFLVQCFGQAQRLASILQDMATLNKIDAAPMRRSSIASSAISPTTPYPTQATALR